MTDGILIKICDQVCQDFQVQLGASTIPLLLLKETNNNRWDQAVSNLNRINYTGKILIDLSNDRNGLMQLEYENQKTRLKEVDVVELTNVKLLHECVACLLKLSIVHKVSFIQLFDVSMLLGNSAFDDNTAMECVLEKIGEWQQYDSSMAVFDVDSLIGVSENMSDSSMGQTSSYSISNNRLWHQVVVQTANSNLSSTKQGLHKWVVVATKSAFVAKQFKTLTKFPLTTDEKNELDENLKEFECLNCQMRYTNGKNNIESCSYHDGPLVDVRTEHQEDMFHITKLDLDKIFAIAQKDQRQDMFKNFVYLCCFQAYNSTGCKKHFHSHSELRKDRTKYRNFFH